MVCDFGRRPRTPLRTGKGGKGFGSRYDVCMDKEELAEERRVLREDEVEDTGARRAPGRVTVGEGEMDIYNQGTEYNLQTKGFVGAKQ